MELALMAANMLERSWDEVLRCSGSSSAWVPTAFPMACLGEPPVVSGDPNYVLEAGMVLSMETEFQHPEVGDVKVEDFIAVTETRCENFTPNGKGWPIA